eukprot:741089-Pelagomonas_calceolata.AAC.1
MRACANCGVTAITPNANFTARNLTHWPISKKAPAALAYPHLLQSMTVEPGMPTNIESKFLTCHNCSQTGGTKCLNKSLVLTLALHTKCLHLSCRGWQNFSQGSCSC